MLAAVAAGFPLLMESARMLIAWPSNFQDLGAMLFMALALHQAAGARLAGAIAALVAALLCKELSATVALLHYGSHAQSAETGPDSAWDFFVIVDDYLAAYRALAELEGVFCEPSCIYGAVSSTLRTVGVLNAPLSFSSPVMA